MLVLSRHQGEKIIIGDDIVITVMDIRGDKVRLGIEAPAKISVHREEVYEAIQRNGPRRSVENDDVSASTDRPGGPVPRPSARDLPAGRE